MINNGDAQFDLIETVALAAGSSPRSLATGDLDQDGDLDIAVAASGSDTVRVLVNNGDDGFQLVSTSFGVGGVPRSIAVADLDRDQFPEIVTANQGSDNISVLVNTRNPSTISFLPAQTFVADSVSHFSVVIADFNEGEDDFPDIAVGIDHSSPGGLESRVGVLLNAGQATLDFENPLISSAAFVFSPAGDRLSLEVGDLDGDGHQDLVAIHTAGDDVGVLFGRGDGTFDLEVSFFVEEATRAVAIGDFNVDGLLDLAVASSDQIRVLLGQGNRQFILGDVFDVGPTLEALVVVDLNGDSLPDLAATNSIANDVKVFLSNP